MASIRIAKFFSEFIFKDNSFHFQDEIRDFLQQFINGTIEQNVFLNNLRIQKYKIPQKFLVCLTKNCNSFVHEIRMGIVQINGIHVPNKSTQTLNVKKFEYNKNINMAKEIPIIRIPPNQRNITVLNTQSKLINYAPRVSLNETPVVNKKIKISKESFTHQNSNKVFLNENCNFNRIPMENKQKFISQNINKVPITENQNNEKCIAEKIRTIQINSNASSPIKHQQPVMYPRRNKRKYSNLTNNENIPTKIIRFEKIEKGNESIIKMAERIMKVPEKIMKVPEKIMKVPERIIKVPERIVDASEKIVKVPERIVKVPEVIKYIPEKFIREEIIKEPENCLTITKKYIEVENKIEIVPERIIKDPFVNKDMLSEIVKNMSKINLSNDAFVYINDAVHQFAEILMTQSAYYTCHRYDCKELFIKENKEIEQVSDVRAQLLNLKRIEKYQNDEEERVKNEKRYKEQMKDKNFLKLYQEKMRENFNEKIITEKKSVINNAFFRHLGKKPNINKIIQMPEKEQLKPKIKRRICMRDFNVAVKKRKRLMSFTTYKVLQDSIKN